MATTIVIVGGHRLYREALCAMLGSCRGLEVVGETHDLSSAVELVRRRQPGVAILDVAAADLSAAHAARRICQLCDTRVVALAPRPDKRFVGEMLKAGASACLLWDCSSEDLRRAIKAVMADQTYLCPKVADFVVDEYIREVPASDYPSPHVLSEREREVLQLVADGQNTKRIAKSLHLSVKTIETHRRQVMAKLGIDSIAGLTKYAIREGLNSL